MSISVKKQGIHYLILTILLILFDLIYEHYSYGQYSIWMRTLFIIPIIAFGINYFIRNSYANMIYHYALAFLLSGHIITGIIEISGRFSKYITIYWIISAGLLFASLLIQYIHD